MPCSVSAAGSSMGSEGPAASWSVCARAFTGRAMESEEEVKGFKQRKRVAPGRLTCHAVRFDIYPKLFEGLGLFRFGYILFSFKILREEKSVIFLHPTTYGKHLLFFFALLESEPTFYIWTVPSAF